MGAYTRTVREVLKNARNKTASPPLSLSTMVRGGYGGGSLGAEEPALWKYTCTTS